MKRFMPSCLSIAAFLLICSNHLHSQTLLINEVDADQGVLDQAEFIEIYDGGGGYTSLNDYVVLISDGPGYLINSTYDLADFETNSKGYFLIAGSGVGGAHYSLPDDSLPDHASIVILYPKPVTVTAIADLDPLLIVDAMVYGLGDPDDDTLLAILDAGLGQPQLNEDEFSLREVHSLQRLPNGGGGALHTDSSIAGLPTPGYQNMSNILINEVDASTVLEDKEYIELYDGGLGQQPLDGLVLVFYDGDTDTRYGPVLDLATYSTDDNGFFLIGNSDVPGVDLVIVSSIIQNGVDGIGLFAGTGGDFTTPAIQTDFLVDGLVYHTKDQLTPGSTIMDLVLTGQDMINEDQFDGKYMHSMQRFPDHSGGNMVTRTYVIAKPTPKASNQATPLINEIDSDQGIIDNLEFIEIYDQGRGNTSLNGYILVLYDGGTDTSYHTFDLNGFQTDADGFFLLGTSQVTGRDIIFSDDFLKDGTHAVALFQADAAAFPNGTPVLTNGLEDAVVYSISDYVVSGLAPLIMDDQVQANENALEQRNVHSLQRYPNGNGGPRVTEFYSPALPTPKMSNTIRANKMVINEMDVDNGAVDSLEFLEIYDGGDGDTSLDGLLIVLFHGVGDLSYRTIDLNGHTTDENGYFLVGTAAVEAEFNVQTDITIDPDTFRDGPEAAVLYQGRAVDFPNGTQLHFTYIEDAIVYDTGDSDDPELLTLLNPGEPQVDESSRGNSAVHSMQRFLNGSGGNQNTSTFAAALPTPDGPNMEGMIINEVDSDTPGTDDREFVELFDGGRGYASLDGLALVFYNGFDDEPYLVLDLDGYSTDEYGFFVVGNAAVIPEVDLVIPDDTIEDGADAVALYSADEADFVVSGMTRAVVMDGLFDAVVYDTNDANDSGLLNLINMGQEQLNEDKLHNKDAHSLQRSPNGSGGPRNSSTFIQAVSTPSAPNIQWSYSTRFTDLDNPGNPGGLNIENDDVIEEWIEITTSEHETNVWSSEREIGFEFVFFGKPVTEFKVSQNGLLTFSVMESLLPADEIDNIDLEDQNQFDPLIPDYTICAFWDSFTDTAPTGSNDKVYMKTFGTEPNRQLWIKWASFEYGSPSSVYNYFGIVLEESSNIVYVMDYNWHSAVPVSSTVAMYSNTDLFVQYDPVSIPLDEIQFLDGNTRSADNQDNDFYEFFPTSNSVDMEVSMVRADPDPFGNINVGDRVTYYVYASNTGDNGATDVVVNLDLSEKLTYFDHSSEGRPFDPGSGDWEVGFVPPGYIAILELIVDVNDSHEVVNGAELIAMSGFDIDSVANNHILAEDDQVELIEMVPDSADLVVEITVDNHIAVIGTEVVFTITLINDGPDAAHYICLQADLPLGLEYVSDTGVGSYSAGIWNAGTLANGASNSIDIRAVVTGHNGTYDYSIVTTAFVCMVSEHDSDLLNNTDSVTIFYRRFIWQTSASSDEVAVNTYTTGIQAFPSVDMTPYGDYQITWQSESGQDGDLSGVYARQYTFPVVSQSGEILVNFFTQNHQRYAQVGMTPLGNSVVVWQDEGQNGLREGIFGMQLDPTGQPILPGQYQIHHYTNAVHTQPDVAVDALGNQIVVWESSGQDGDGMGVYGRLFDSTNLPITAEFEITTTTAWDQIHPRVSCDPDGNFAVTWQSWDQDGDGWAIMGRHFAADATPSGPEFIVHTEFADDQINPDIAMSSEGEFIIVWQGPLSDTEFGIFGRAFAGTGAPKGPVFQVNTYSQMLVASPRVAMDSFGNFVVVWYSLSQDGGGAGVYGQQFRVSGMPEGFEFQVNTTTVEDQSFPDVACNAEGQFVVTWQSYLQDSDVEGIYVRAFEPPCQPLRDPSVWPQLSILELLNCIP